jgi:hypothetical protein
MVVHTLDDSECRCKSKSVRISAAKGKTGEHSNGAVPPSLTSGRFSVWICV